ncbi:MAG: hypothetical protein KGL39_42885 [Patescibacteria group bacterium]|nr:hypothetical protein [Patescibacteria group bacterium]
MPTQEKLLDVKPKRIPRNVRRLLERKLKQAEDNLIKGWGVWIKANDPTDHTKQNTFPMKTVETWNPKWVTESGDDWEDPATGEKKRIRVSEVRTYGRNGNGTNTINVSRKNFQKFVKECAALLDEFDPNGLIAQESLGDFGDWDFNTWNTVATQGAGTANGKYLPYQPGPYTRQIYIQDQWLMLARAAELVNYNPLAKAGIHIKSAFTIGKGPKIIISPKQVQDGKATVKAQEAWDEYSERVKFGTNLANRDRMLSTNGEFFNEFYLTKDNKPISKSIDPGTVYDIVAEPRDIDIIYGLVLMYPTRYQTYTQGAKGERVNVSEFVFETIPPDNVVHLKINVQENEMRGRSDLLPVMNICDWFMDYLKYKVLQAWVHSAFAWDITMKNAEQSDVDAMSTNENATAPAPMSTYVHNDQVERKPLQAASGQGGMRSSIFEEIVTSFCCGIMVPTEYVGLSTTGNRATSVTKTEPSVKVFNERRAVWDPAIKREVQFVVKNQTGIELDESDIELSWDEIAPENVTERITNLLIGLVNKSITKQRFDTMYAKLMEIGSYDWDKEQENIIMEMAKDPMIANAVKAVPTKPPFTTQTPSATAPPQPTTQPPIQGSATNKPQVPNPSSNAGVKEIKKQHQVA